MNLFGEGKASLQQRAKPQWTVSILFGYSDLAINGLDVARHFTYPVVMSHECEARHSTVGIV